MKHQFIIPEDGLRRILTTTRHAAATKWQPELNGIYLYVVNKEFRAVATDNARIAVDHINLPTGAEKFPGIGIPMSIVREILRRIGRKSTVKKITIRANNSSIEFHGPSYLVKTTALHDSFSPYLRKVEKLMKKLNSTCICTTRQLRNTLRDFPIKGEEITAVRFKTNRLEFETPNGIISLTAITHGKPLNAGFRTKYLRDIISRINGEQTIITFGKQPGDPLLIKDDSAEYMVMPTY